jgi:hypothetical protein
MTRGAAFELQRAMLKYKRSLFIGMALNTCRVSADRELRLFLLESAVRIVAIAALHRAFEYSVVKWFSKLRFRFVVTRHAKLRLICSEHLCRRLTRILFRDVPREYGRAGSEIARCGTVCRMAFGATDVISPVLAAAEVIVGLLARVACQTSFGDRFRIAFLK